MTRCSRRLTGSAKVTSRGGSGLKSVVFQPNPCFQCGLVEIAEAKVGGESGGGISGGQVFHLRVFSHYSDFPEIWPPGQWRVTK